MLVLSRRVSESIQIGEGIIVSVVRIEGDRVRLGITAPTEIRVVRSELLEAVVAENLRAAQTPRPAVPLAWRQRVKSEELGVKS